MSIPTPITTLPPRLALCLTTLCSAIQRRRWKEGKARRQLGLDTFCVRMELQAAQGSTRTHTHQHAALCWALAKQLNFTE